MLRRLLRDVRRTILSDSRPLDADAPHANEANPLEEYFFNNPGRSMSKWRHYLEIYHRHLAKFRGFSPVAVEIGIGMGGSLQMWRHYFGPGARIVGIDVRPECLDLQDDATTIMIGNQEDGDFLATVRQRFPRIDILIDDGGHTTAQQRTTFEELYPHLQPYGVYLCEDLHTSLWPSWGGGHNKPGTFLEYSKSLVDKLSAWHSEGQPTLPVDQFTQTTHSIHFYDSVVVIEKRPMERPRHLRSDSVS